MALDTRTIGLMRELFAGRSCCICGGAAQRVVEDRFLCHRHFHSGRRPPQAKAVERRARRPAAEPSPAEPPPAEPCGESGVSAPAELRPKLSA